MQQQEETSAVNDYRCKMAVCWTELTLGRGAEWMGGFGGDDYRSTIGLFARVTSRWDLYTSHHIYAGAFYFIFSSSHLQIFEFIQFPVNYRAVQIVFPMNKRKGLVSCLEASMQYGGEQGSANVDHRTGRTAALINHEGSAPKK